MIESNLKYICNNVVNFAFKTKVENKPNYFSSFSMPITRKIYSFANQSTIYKILLVISLIFPLIIFLEFTVGNICYSTIGNLLIALKNRKVAPFSYQWSGLKIALISSIAMILIDCGFHAHHARIFTIPQKLDEIKKLLESPQQETEYLGTVLKVMGGITIIFFLSQIPMAAIGSLYWETKFDEIVTQGKKKISTEMNSFFSGYSSLIPKEKNWVKYAILMSLLYKIPVSASMIIFLEVRDYKNSICTTITDLFGKISRAFKKGPSK